MAHRCITDSRRTTTWSSSRDGTAASAAACCACMPDKGRVDRRGRELHQAAHAGQPAEEHQGRHRRARGAAARVERADRLPGVRRADARRAASVLDDGTARAVLPEVQGSGGQMSAPERALRQGRGAGAPQGVRLHERHGRAADHEGRRQHGPRRGHAERQDRRHRRRGARQDHRPEGRRSRGRRSRSRSSSCARTCRSARWSRCAASGCTSSSIG